MSMFEAIAEPTRRRILDELRSGDHTVSHLVEVTGLSQPGVSKHLRVLRDAGLVDAEPDGQRRRYRIRSDGLAEIEQWLEPFRRTWSERLDHLQQHLDTVARREESP